MREVIRALLGGDASPGASSSPFDEAILGGARASGVGGAFLAGYRAALRALVPSLPAGGAACLCATEEGGAHPRAIATRLVPEPDGDSSHGGFTLSGRKQWATGADGAATLLVVASIGLDDQGKNRLRVARVNAHAPGVTLTPMPPTPFAPEIGHAVLTLDGVRVAAADVLPGDGYDLYLKPFRTVEDLHVHGAVLAYVLAVGRRAGWPSGSIERGLAVLLAARTAAAENPSAPETHLATAGVLGLGRDWLDQTAPHWALVDEDTCRRWLRDAPLMRVAEKVRTARTAAAWKALAGG